jgi:hypothetical protein
MALIFESKNFIIESREEPFITRSDCPSSESPLGTPTLRVDVKIKIKNRKIK